MKILRKKKFTFNPFVFKSLEGRSFSDAENTVINKIKKTTHTNTTQQAFKLESGKVKETQSSLSIQQSRVAAISSIFENKIPKGKEAAFAKYLKENMDDFFGAAGALDQTRKLNNWKIDSATEIMSSAEYSDMFRSINTGISKLTTDVAAEKDYNDDLKLVDDCQQKVFDALVTRMERGVSLGDLSFVSWDKGSFHRGADYCIKVESDGSWLLSIDVDLKTPKARIALAKSLNNDFSDGSAVEEAFYAINSKVAPLSLGSVIATSNVSVKEAVTPDETAANVPEGAADKVKAAPLEKEAYEKIKEKYFVGTVAANIKAEIFFDKKYNNADKAAWNTKFQESLNPTNPGEVNILIIQRALATAGYPIKEDGIAGPQTIFALSAACGDPVQEKSSRYNSNNDHVASLDKLAAAQSDDFYKVEKVKKANVGAYLDYLPTLATSSQKISTMDPANAYVIDGQWGFAFKLNLVDKDKTYALFVTDEKNICFYETSNPTSFYRSKINPTVSEYHGMPEKESLTATWIEDTFTDMFKKEEVAAAVKTPATTIVKDDADAGS